MSSATLSQTSIDASNREEWIYSRSTFIGASESHQVCKGDRLKVYLRKAGLLDPEPINLAMRMGLALEPLIADRYQEEGLGRIVKTQVLLRKQETPWVGATVDGILDDGNLVEFKYAGEHRRNDFGEDGGDDIPEPWIFQAQQQMYVNDSERVDFAVFVGSDFRWFRVARHQGLIDAILRIEDEFWHRHVEPRIPPALGEDTPAEHVLALYREPESWTFLDGQVSRVVDAYEESRSLLRRHEKEVQRHRSMLLQLLGGFAEGHLPDGRTVRRVESIRNVKASPAKQSKYTQIKIDRTRDI